MTRSLTDEKLTHVVQCRLKNSPRDKWEELVPFVSREQAMEWIRLHAEAYPEVNLRIRSRKDD
jgi:hypothetical protein